MSHPTINLTIDGRPVTVHKGLMIIEAARQLGIEIPVYCYHPKLEPVGACRVCVVEVEGQRRPIMPACATEVMEGMVVHTRSQNAIAAREGVLEFLLINHPLDCPVCDRGGECDLQDFTLRYGPPKSRFVETKRHFAKSVTVGKDVVLDRERCIMCWRCVRFCKEISMDEGLTLVERGSKAEVGTFPGKSFDSPFSGNTVEICPVGALTSHTYRFKSRPWELQNFASVCPHCAVGCNLTVDVRYYDVVRFRSRVNDRIDDGWLCDRGRYGHRFISSPDRLKTPMVRKGGQLVETTWDEALKAAAEGLKKAGSEAGAFAGPRISNEAAWQLTRLTRSTLNSGNLDHRHGTLPRHPLTATIEGLDTATAVVVVNCNPTEDAPVLDLRIKKAIRHGAGLIIVGADTGLDDYADVKLASLDELKKALDGYEAPEKPAITHPAPRPWEPGGKTLHDAKEAAHIVRKSPHVTVVYGEEAPQDEIQALLAAPAPHGLMLVVKGANSTGLREMGVLPQTTFDPGEAWGGFSQAKGDPRQAKALLLVGENNWDKKPEFLVAVDLFLTDIAKQADVVLPACSFAEQAMTMTSLDGTVQLCRQALAPLHESLPDWQILTRLAAALGQTWKTDSAAAIFAEIGQLNPLYKGASYNDFQTPATQHWSYPQQGRIGTPRPDLSGIPVRRPDAPPWMATEPTGSRVENVARLVMSDGADHPPAVPGQEDPRRIAARMSLLNALQAAPHDLPEGAASRVLASSSPQPPGPSPAQRYHHIGMGVREEIPGAEKPAEEEATVEPA